MKNDKSLEQVWGWKDSIYHRVRNLSTRKQLESIIREARVIEQKSKICLRKALTKSLSKV